MLRKILLCLDGIAFCLLAIVGVDYTNYIANIKYVNNAKTVILDDVINLNIDNKNIVLENMQYDSFVEKTFRIENLSDQETMFNILFSDIVNDFDNELVYELYEDTKLVLSETVLPKSGSDGYVKLGIILKSAENKNYTLKFTLKNKLNQPIEYYNDKKFSANIKINSLKINASIKTATNYLLANNIICGEEEQGLFKTNDTNSGLESYYYKGSVLNNYVKFNNEFWRIVRINEDGSIRIIKDENIKTNIIFSEDKLADDANDYNNSNIKNELENYYNNNMKQYETMLTSQNYCIKKSVVRNENYKTRENDKMYLEYNASLKCDEENIFKIGLISYDEAVLSGLSYSNNSLSYLNNGYDKNTWTITSAGVNNWTNEKYAWYIDNSLKETSVINDKISIRPVVNLKGTLNLVGNGTLDNPYIFSE